jgi:hypothetical protein
VKPVLDRLLVGCLLTGLVGCCWLLKQSHWQSSTVVAGAATCEAVHAQWLSLSIVDVDIVWCSLSQDYVMSVDSHDL